MKIEVIIVLTFILFFLPSCDSDPFGLVVPYGSSGLVPPFVSFDDLSSAPNQVQIEEQNFVFAANLYRDFMPDTQEGGSPLVASVRVIEVDSLDIAPEI